MANGGEKGLTLTISLVDICFLVGLNNLFLKGEEENMK